MSSKNVMAKITTTRLKSVATTMLKKHEKEYKNKTKDSDKELKNIPVQQNPDNASVPQQSNKSRTTTENDKVRTAKKFRMRINFCTPIFVKKSDS